MGQVQRWFLALPPDFSFALLISLSWRRPCLEPKNRPSSLA